MRWTCASSESCTACRLFAVEPEGFLGHLGREDSAWMGMDMGAEWAGLARKGMG